MWSAISEAVTNMITSVGSVVTAIVGESGALKELLPVLAIGIACSVILFGVKAIKSIAWGA